MGNVIYYGCTCDCVCGCVRVVLAVNIKAVESGNSTNVCAFNRSQKGCFMMFYSIFVSLFSVYSYLCCVELPACPIIVWNSRDPEDQF